MLINTIANQYEFQYDKLTDSLIILHSITKTHDISSPRAFRAAAVSVAKLMRIKFLQITSIKQVLQN